jgi:hypothetical protein
MAIRAIDDNCSNERKLSIDFIIALGNFNYVLVTALVLSFHLVGFRHVNGHFCGADGVAMYLYPEDIILEQLKYSWIS